MNRWIPSHYISLNGNNHYIGIVKKFSSSVMGNHSLVKIKFRMGDWKSWARTVTNTIQMVSKIPRITFSGVSILTKKGYVYTYEHLNDKIGMMHALFTRQLKTGLEPDKEVMREFSKFSKEFINQLLEKILKAKNVLLLDIKLELKNCHSYSAAKKKKYFNHCIKTLSRSENWDSKIDKHFYKAMVKIGEKYCMTFEEMKMFVGGAWEPSDRQRLIFCPEGEAGNGLLTMMLRPLLRILKTEMTSFCHSVSCT